MRPELLGLGVYAGDVAVHISEAEINDGGGCDISCICSAFRHLSVDWLFGRSSVGRHLHLKGTPQRELPTAADLRRRRLDVTRHHQKTPFVDLACI